MLVPKGFDTNYGVPIHLLTLSLICTLPRCCRVLVALLKVWAALICCNKSFVLVVSKLRCLRLRGGGVVCTCFQGKVMCCMRERKVAKSFRSAYGAIW